MLQFPLNTVEFLVEKTNDCYDWEHHDMQETFREP